MNYIDVRSDTVTHPTKEMKEAFLSAQETSPIDEVDPLVLTLENQAAQIFGMEAAAFTLCGTFSNECCIKTHTNPGDEIFVMEDSHLIKYETGGLGAVCQVVVHGLKLNEEKLLKVDQLKKHIKYLEKGKTGKKKYVFSMENPTSFGKIHPLDQYHALTSLAKEKGLAVHIDGARVFNASACLNVDPKVLVKNVDSLMFCLSKGLCGPLGSLVLGSKNFIQSFKENQIMMSSAMENMGRYAAMGLVGLRKMRFELYKDHEIAVSLANQMQNLGWIKIVESVDMTMVFFRFTDQRVDSAKLQSLFLKNGVKIHLTRIPGGLKRLIVHYYIREAQVDKIISIFKEYHSYMEEEKGHLPCFPLTIAKKIKS